MRMFSDQNRIRLKMSNKSNLENPQSIWKVNNTPLNKPLSKQETQGN